MSDRIVVLHEGRVTAEVPRDRATQELVMFAATGNVAGDGHPTGVTEATGEVTGGGLDG
jgi:rhamnose transport system ATP-binding protein